MTWSRIPSDPISLNPINFHLTNREPIYPIWSEVQQKHFGLMHDSCFTFLTVAA